MCVTGLKGMAMGDLDRERFERMLRPGGYDPFVASGVRRFAGVVTTGGAPGAFIGVRPNLVTGPETLGASATWTPILSEKAVYLLGPQSAVVGDKVTCRYVGDRWETSVGAAPGGPATMPCTMGGVVLDMPTTGMLTANVVWRTRLYSHDTGFSAFVDQSASTSTYFEYTAPTPGVWVPSVVGGVLTFTAACFEHWRFALYQTIGGVVFHNFSLRGLTAQITPCGMAIGDTRAGVGHWERTTSPGGPEDNPCSTVDTLGIGLKLVSVQASPLLIVFSFVGYGGADIVPSTVRSTITLEA